MQSVNVGLSGKRESSINLLDDETEKDSAVKVSDTWKHLPPGYSPFMVSITLYCVFFVNLFMNIDMGIMASGTDSIKVYF